MPTLSNIHPSHFPKLMLYSLVETLPLFRLSKLKPTSKLQAIKMQATLHLSPISSVSPLAFVTTKSLALPCIPLPRPLHPSRCPPLRATNVTDDDPSSVDYSSITSVFPAEACETVGGEACDAEMYPEVKLKPEESGSSTARTSSEQLDRDYLEYDSPKTVFPGEACDDLGGEFCEPEYQRGVN